MNKQNRRFLACAVALATSFAAVPGVSHAEVTAKPAGQAAAAVAAESAGTASAPAAANTSAPAEKTAETAAQQGNVQEDKRTADWGKNRPQEDAIEKYSKEYEGQTIVDTVFEGATAVSEATAKAALSMKTGDMFTVNGMNKDREAIYNTGYFYDLFPTFQKVPEGVVVTYHVLENPIIKGVEITGNTVYKTEDLRSYISVKNGEILNSRNLQQNVQAIKERYRNDGYILAKVTDMNIDNNGNLTLKINEGVLEGYKVKGNTKTKDYVILREMRQKPGQPFNSKLARRSMQRVYNLGFFEDVNIKMNPGVEPNAVVMELDVKEKRTGTFGIGAGYSTKDGVIGMVSVGDTNFRGTGDAVSITYERSGNAKDAHGFTFAWRHPYLDKKETVGTLRIYNRTYEYSDYDTNGNLKESYMRKYAGGEITLGRPVSEYSTNYITFRNRTDSYVRHTKNGNMGDRSNDWAWRNSNFGTTRSVTFEHVTDTRDNIYNPTEGGRVSLSAEVAGLGGDFNFQKATIEDQRYFKVGHAQVIAVRGKYGLGNGEISEFNQFKVGGQNSLRGYRDDQYRGDHMILATLEYRFPIVSKVQGAIFTDWGGAWFDDFMPKSGAIHGSVGVGLALNTPLGPLRLDYGRGSNGGRVHFSVGGAF
ncbi:BamA/OMP85 family outer membrane protein [Selenomonas ruminantium]|uniref:Outer membrane protein insertion porin family n=1 Tax=Selenomonas ruminantium TaxID=971 RepID=A0A1K1MZK0_SELRU|nr:outer membrane protein assembly factor [Selenomonas ruminantium]SFW28539.1 outer membrane protein insertion porin family [Selenomonas ruminantium]